MKMTCDNYFIVQCHWLIPMDPESDRLIEQIEHSISKL